MMRTLGKTLDGSRNGRTPGCRARLSVLLVALLWVAGLSGGCATTGPSRPSDFSSAGEETSPELDFLVARDLEQDGQLEQALKLYARALSKDPESVYLLKQVAELSARQNRLTDALVYAERALELAPDDEGVRLFLGTLYRFRKDADNARRVLLTPEGEPVSTDSALVLYGIVSDARSYDEARDLAEWLIVAEPDALRGHFALADAMEKLGDPAGSEAALRHALELHPEEMALYGALARGRRDRGDRVGEVEIYQEILIIHPDQHGTLVALSDAQLALRRIDDAVATLEQIEAAHPTDIRSSLRIAFIELERDNWPAASERFQRALAENPDQHEVRYFLGIALRRMDNGDESIAAFEAIPEDHERFPEARTQIAAIHERSGHFELAITQVELARTVNPSRPLDLYLASLRSKSGDLDGALEFLEGLLNESPDDAELLYNIGVIHGEAKNVDEAIRYMEIVLGKNPDHPGALNYVGYTLAERGTDLEEAEAMISRALELRPDDGYITDSLGWVYYMRARPLMESGRVEEGQELLARAVNNLRRAAELTGGDPVVSEHLGDVYLLLDQQELALREYEEAMRLDPRWQEQPMLRHKLEQLRRELERK